MYCNANIAYAFMQAQSWPCPQPTGGRSKTIFPLRISYTCALFYYKRRIEQCFPILRIMKTIVGFSVRVW